MATLSDEKIPMQRAAAAVLTAGATLMATAGVMTTTAAASPGASADDEALRLERLIVRVDDGLNARAIAREHTQKLGVRVGQVYRSAIDGYSARVPAAAVAALNADPRVTYLQRDRQVHTTAQTTPTGINRSDADLSPTAAINGVDQRVTVDVAVIDTASTSTTPT